MYCIRDAVAFAVDTRRRFIYYNIIAILYGIVYKNPENGCFCMRRVLAVYCQLLYVVKLYYINIIRAPSL